MPKHTPVLVDEVLDLLRPSRPGLYVDGTVGLGGHAEALLERGHAEARLLGFDRDAESLALARERLAPFGDRVELVHDDFREAPSYLKLEGAPAPSGAGCWTSGSAPCTSTSPSGASPSRKKDLST